MKDFLTGLQFLTRIKFLNQKEWTEEGFARSVPWFPLVGAVIGLFLAGLNIAMQLHFTDQLRAVLLIAAEIAITGGLLCDGLMDTADGVFSGRERSRMLEIMKDSAVGANGMMAFVMLVLVKTAIYLSIPAPLLTPLLFAMPVVTRFIIVGGIILFPYAREEGIGKLFTLYAKKNYLYLALFFMIIALMPFLSWQIYLCTMVAILYSWLAACYLCKILGGLTGDTYGFLAETGNVVFLFASYLCIMLLGRI